MKPEKKAAPARSGALEPEHSEVIERPDTSLLSASPQQIVARLKNTLDQVNRLPVIEGEPGRLLLDALEYLDKIRDGIRERMREAIYQEPDLVPGWHVEEVVIKKRCRNREGRP
jgi:hypothetical protein